MNAVFRHMSVRLWGTVFGGGLICMALLPPWQRAWGLAAIYLPVTVVLVACFLALGWLMNRLGLASVRRQVSEAAVWERAGMSAEAENAFERAKAVYDGFWLSPLERRRCADWVSMRLARFYLAQATLGRKDHAMVLSYLETHPEDDAVALTWLEAALRRERHSPQEHEVAARVGEALEENDHVQRLLMQFYLTDRRSDFEAMQTYRRVWRQSGELPEASIRTLAQVLLNDSVINDWALEVYLKGYALGDPHCLEGIAAGERLLSPNTANRGDLATAREILAVLDESQRRKLIRPFEPEAPAPIKVKTHKTGHLTVVKPKPQSPAPIEVIKDEPENWDAEELEAQSALSAKGEQRQGPSVLSVCADAVRRGLTALAIMAWHGLGRAFAFLKASSILAVRAWHGSKFSIPSVARFLKRHAISALQAWRQSAKVRRACAYAAAGAAVLLMAIAGWRAMGRTPALTNATPAPSVETTAPPVTDPFTIQVAAFLKPEDAQHFVDRLKQQQVDAFWSKATSANRAWYQVKVSHFATRDDARRYGQTLRSKGLIDDFYVANYSK